MSDKGFTDDEVRDAHSRAVRLAELTDVATPWKELIWAASEYLKAKAVIEWYAPAEKYVCGFKSGNGYMTHNGPMIAEDHGNKAREYLNTLKKS